MDVALAEETHTGRRVELREGRQEAPWRVQRLAGHAGTPATAPSVTEERSQSRSMPPGRHTCARGEVVLVWVWGAGTIDGHRGCAREWLVLSFFFLLGGGGSAESGLEIRGRQEHWSRVVGEDIRFQARFRCMRGAISVAGGDVLWTIVSCDVQQLVGWQGI